MIDDDDDYRIKQWQPPPRPEWVQRINEEGECLVMKSAVPLDENSLLASAKANTGLSDFGTDDWYEPFKVFIMSIDDEAGLTLMGRLMTRADLIMWLEARLRIEDTYKRHPEIADQELSPPVMIVGSGRSGTTAIHNLLSFDPDNGVTMQWEAMYPVPAPEAATYHTDPRIAIADRRITLQNRVTPEVVSAHEYAGDLPTELNYIGMICFQSPRLSTYGPAPSYGAYWAKRDPMHTLNYSKRVLKLLQWKNPHPRWMLKSPDTMSYLPELFKVFPDMRLVWMHRDPLKSVSSMVSLVGILNWVRSDKQMDEKAMANITNPAGLAGWFNKVIDQIEQGTIPKTRIHHIHYLDFIDDPMRTVKTLYQEMGVSMTDEARRAMETYVNEHPRESRPAHKYNVGTDDRRAAERKLFERYQNMFNGKLEI